MNSFSELKENWQSLGNDDPLWAILSDPRAKGGRWSLVDFFKAGEVEIDRVFKWIQEHGVRELRFGRALDFGCGAGRLTRALATRLGRCTGVDVAASMIETARKLEPPANCEFVLNERPDLSVFPDRSFDFVYSSIVLQHIPYPYSVDYISEFCRLLTPGGLMVFQIPIDRHVPLAGRLAELKRRVAAKIALRTRVRRMLGHSVPRPSVRIDMHTVPFSTIEQRLATGGIKLVATGFTNSCDSSFNGNLQISSERRYHEYLLSCLFLGRKETL
jgi:2-polyprenyl-3-methyl-5-hydroxy-6-metoxy-1,4-benzoquinol methylase